LKKQPKKLRQILKSLNK